MFELTEELSRELKNKYNPDGSTLRLAQVRMVEMLKFIDKICSDNDIDYWIDSGTLLGAVRHEGFIPWDDDMDVVMTWKDYKKFKKLMIKNNPSDEFILQCHKTDKGCYRVWGSIRDLKSECLQDSKLHKFQKYRGLNMDIFVYRDLYFKFFYRVCMYINCKKIEVRLHQGKNDVITKFYYLLLRILRCFFYLLNYLYPGKRDDLHHFYGSGFSECHLKSNVYPLRRIMFEGVECNAPSNINGYLEELYGKTWNLIPDEIDRQTHEIEVLFNS